MAMLLMGQQLIGKPVMSLRTGGAIGLILDPIINPNNLKLEGWFVEDRVRRQRWILLSQDIRDIIEQGFVVDDENSLTDSGELVRLKQVLEIGFELIGKVVTTENKQRLGRVNDYAFEKNAFFVQKLYIGQSLIKSFSGGSAIVDRTQIIEINNKKIVVREATVPGKATTVNAATSPAMNPVQPELF
jgi:uncharacterized protein YrrD